MLESVVGQSLDHDAREREELLVGACAAGRARALKCSMMSEEEWAVSTVWDVFYEVPGMDGPRQWGGIVDGETIDQARERAAQFYRKPGSDLSLAPVPRQKRPDFDPTEALARYRELESLLNLELISKPQWQAMRRKGDTSFLLASRHFQEQERLSIEIEENGYTILLSEDKNENPVYEIEPLEV